MIEEKNIFEEINESKIENLKLKVSERIQRLNEYLSNGEIDLDEINMIFQDSQKLYEEASELKIRIGVTKGR